MEIDRKKLAGLAALPEEQFAALICSVITAAGGSRMQIKAALSNAPKIREKLLTASDGEIRDLTSSLDPAVLGQIVSIIDKGGKDHG